MWEAFVHAIIDTQHANGPVSPRNNSEPPAQGPVVLPAAERLIAVGDLHGDLAKARRAFRLAGLIDSLDRWAGGNTVAVQVGDILDRGDEEVELFFWLERLQREAEAAGGALHVLNGNHETMNVAQQFRYATPGGYVSFRSWAQTHSLEAALKGRCGCSREDDFRKALHMRTHDGVSARAAALCPGGAISTRFIAPHPVVLQVGSTVFVHGGLLPEHVAYGVDKINAETREWVLHGPPSAKPRFLSGRDAVVWSRQYSTEDASRCNCEALTQALAGMPGAARMVVGHTIQESGINSACDGRVLRVDVGLSKGCGDGKPQVLEIIQDRVVRRLEEASAPVRQWKEGQGAAVEGLTGAQRAQQMEQ